MNVYITVASNILSEYFQKYKRADERKRGGVSTNFKKLKKQKPKYFVSTFFIFKQTIQSIQSIQFNQFN